MQGIRARPVPAPRRKPSAEWRMGALDDGYMEVSTPDPRRSANSLDAVYMDDTSANPLDGRYMNMPASPLDGRYMNMPADPLDGGYMNVPASPLDGGYMNVPAPRRPVPAPRRPVPAPRYRDVSVVPSDADLLEAAASFEAQLAGLQQGDAIVVDLDAGVNAAQMPECKAIVGARSACEARADCGPYVRAGVERCRRLSGKKLECKTIVGARSACEARADCGPYARAGMERCRRLSGKRLATVNAPSGMTCEGDKCFRQSGKKAEAPKVPKRVSSKRNSAKTQRCHGVTKAGKRCQNRTTDMYCSVHAK